MMNQPDLRVFILADNPLARVGLAALLTEQTDCEIVGQFGADAEWLEDMPLFAADVAVWDVDWETSQSGDYLTALHDAGLPVLALISDEESAVRLLTDGVQGVLLRHADARLLTTALQTVAAGLIVIDPALRDVIFPDTTLNSDALVEELTPREMEVLQLLAEGLPNKIIAQRLGVSEHTIKFHVNAILSKLGAQSRTEAVVRATRLGLIIL